MQAFKLSKLSTDWVIISVWRCKYDDARCCVCCQPKHVVSPRVLKNPNREVRDFFRMTDASGKSITPSQSRHIHRLGEPRNSK